MSIQVCGMYFLLPKFCFIVGTIMFAVHCVVIKAVGSFWNRWRKWWVGVLVMWPTTLVEAWFVFTASKSIAVKCCKFTLVPGDSEKRAPVALVQTHCWNSVLPPYQSFQLSRWTWQHGEETWLTVQLSHSFWLPEEDVCINELLFWYFQWQVV